MTGKEMKAMRLFLSYTFRDEKFVDLVYYLLSKQAFELYYWREDGRDGDWSEELEKKIDSCEGMIAFLGSELGETQKKEIAYYLGSPPRSHFIPVQLTVDLPTGAGLATAGKPTVKGYGPDDEEDRARDVARQTTHLLGVPWEPLDGLPNRYIVENEKEFLKLLGEQDEKLLRSLRSECGWTQWPTVRKEHAELDNPINDMSIGKLSDGSSTVLLDLCQGAGSKDLDGLTLLDARPRMRLRYPLQQGGMLRVGVLVSGGIAPGINAVIDGIVARHCLYSRRQIEAGRKHFLQILGYREGFKGLLRPGVPAQPLNEAAIRSVVEAGGSYLGTSRADDLLPESVHGSADRNLKLLSAVERLKSDGINILYVIGGDGSMSCAHALWHYARRNDYQLSVVGIPKAMDNDILWVWQSFGFLSAVEEARQAILKMHTEVSSNPRVGVIQLFGSDSGFIASHAGYSTACDLVLIPEDPMSMDEIVAHVSRKLQDRFANGQYSAGPYAIVVMAETALPKDAESYCYDVRAKLTDDERKELKRFLSRGRRVRGQTPDDLRRAALKIVSGVLEKRIQAELKPEDYWRDFRVITNEPRHLIRSIPPSVSDVIFGERLGALAVDNAMAGYTDFMVSQWLTEFVLVPLPLVVLGRKRVPIDGIFWKSVLSKTEQRAKQP
jgi:6-phosphofructokinase 1